MNEQKAQEIVIISLGVTLASTVAGTIILGKKEFTKENDKKLEHTVVAGFFAMLGSSLLAEASPEAGAGIAVLVAGAAFFAYGLPALQKSGYISKAETKQQKEAKNFEKYTGITPAEAFERIERHPLARF